MKQIKMMVGVASGNNLDNETYFKIGDDKSITLLVEILPVRLRDVLCERNNILFKVMQQQVFNLIGFTNMVTPNDVEQYLEQLVTVLNRVFQTLEVSYDKNDYIKGITFQSSVNGTCVEMLPNKGDLEPATYSGIDSAIVAKACYSLRALEALLNKSSLSIIMEGC